MKTILSNLSNCGIDQFSFAGFSFPKHVWTLDRAPLAKRLADRKTRCTGAYYHAPKPDEAGNGMSFYLDSDGQPFARWSWCDEVDGANIDHTGWFCDEYHDSKIRGIVVRLSRGRFLAGWSMGKRMASYVDGSEVFTDEADCAHRANDLAETAADNEREYQEKYQAAQDLSDANETALQRLRECLALRNNACFAALRDEARDLVETIRSNRDTLRTTYAGMI
jgi:hypothetical protein